MAEYVSVDIGYGFVKAISSSGKRALFPSVVGSGRERGLASFLETSKKEIDESELHVKVNGKHYFVGEMALRNSSDVSRVFDRVRFNHEYTMILLHVAIQLVADPAEDEIVIYTGLPLDYYKTQVKDFTTKLYEPFPTLEWQFGHSLLQMKRNRIVEARVFPQALSAIWATLINADGRFTQPELMVEGSQVAVIDIGFRTTDICVVEMKQGGGFIPVLNLSDTLDIGVVNLYENVKSAYQDITGGAELSESKISKLLKTNTIRYKGKQFDLSEPIQKAHEAVVTSIFDRIHKLWKNEADTFDQIFLVGGGSHVFSDYFNRQQPEMYKLIVDSQFANAIGYYRIGKMLSQNTDKAVTS